MQCNNANSTCHVWSVCYVPALMLETLYDCAPWPNDRGQRRWKEFQKCCFNPKWNFILNILCLKQFVGNLCFIKPISSKCNMQAVCIDNLCQEMLSRNKTFIYFYSSGVKIHKQKCKVRPVVFYLSHFSSVLFCQIIKVPNCYEENK